MTDFKWRHFQGDVILWAVRWYCRYPISYRDLEAHRPYKLRFPAGAGHGEVG